MPRTTESPTHEEVLGAMDECEPYWAGELADELDSTRRTVHRRLDDLVDEGDVEKKRRGERKVIFWIRD